MSPPPTKHLNAERVAYWYLRLNGFLQIENFVVHPSRRGSQRTDADLLGVRFRHRMEFLYDLPEPMADDERLLLSPDYDDIVITEVKSRQPCTLNGPWTRPEDRNVDRVLAAVGCLRTDEIGAAAASIYDSGVAIVGTTRIRLVAIGRPRNPSLQQRYPHVLQLTWNDVLDFVWRRFQCYRDQKRHSDQWDFCGRHLRNSAICERVRDTFIDKVGREMGVHSQDVEHEI